MPLNNNSSLKTTIDGFENLKNVVNNNRIALRDKLDSKYIEVSENERLSSLINKVDNIGVIDIISATELPTSGRENQICVITDNPVDNYIVTSNFDDIDSQRDDMTYIYLSNSSSEGVKVVIGDNPIYNFYIGKVCKGANRCASYINKSNIWTPLTLSSLYFVENKAEVNKDYFGGLMSNSYLKFTTNGIQIGGNTIRCTLCTTNNKIDFSLYNKITIKGYSNYSSTGTLSMGCSSSKKSIPSSTDLSISSYCTKYSQLNIRNGEFKHEIDISTWKDTGYFLMLGYTYNSTFIITDLCFS